MHVSLDSALGRQRRLNSVGESVLQIAPNAAAAYSLRSLTGGDPKVVRVRRGSNNVESDFTASGVSSGALLDFVTTSQIGWNVQPTFSNAAGTGSITSQSSTATTATVSFTGEASLIRETSKPNHVLGSSGDQVIFNISVSGLDSAGTLRLRTSGTNTTVGSSSVSNGDNQDITLNLTGSAGYLAMTFVASSGGTITFNSITVLPKSGFVETWYDQSGNSEDAVQETSGSQPLIVSAGALVANGLDFDGSDDKLNIPNDLIASINSASSFLVAKSDTVSSSRIALALSHSTSNFRFYVGALLSSKFYFGYQDTALKIELSAADTNKHLFTSIAGSSNTEAFLDGTSKGTVSSVDGKSTLSSGGIGSINTGNFWSGTIQEVIVYNTDQSANRVALETNIQTAYPTLP